MDIGKALIKLRYYKGCNQKVVANFLNIERSTYARLEGNKTHLTISLATKLATFYGMELNYFSLCLEFERYLCCITTERVIMIKKQQEKILI